MAWNFVSSRLLQKGNLYGVWVTTTGVTSTDEVVRWLQTRKWQSMTVLPRGTLPTGQMVKEMRGVWMGADGTVLPASDTLLGYGPLFVTDSPTGDPGEVPSRAPGERPPITPEVTDAMRRAQQAAKPGRWKVPVLVLGALGVAAYLGLQGPEDDDGEPEKKPEPGPAAAASEEDDEHDDL